MIKDYVGRTYYECKLFQFYDKILEVIVKKCIESALKES